MQSKSLEVELTDDKGRYFIIQFESESENRNIVMSVLYESLPIDYPNLPDYDAELYYNINKAVETTATDWWVENALSRPVADAYMNYLESI